MSVLDRAAFHHVARMKGGHVLHIVDYEDGKLRWDAPAICGQHPTERGYRGKMRSRAGWEVYKQESSRVSNCRHCLAVIEKAST